MAGEVPVSVACGRSPVDVSKPGLEQAPAGSSEHSRHELTRLSHSFFSAVAEFILDPGPPTSNPPPRIAASEFVLVRIICKRSPTKAVIGVSEWAEEVKVRIKSRRRRARVMSEHRRLC